MSLRRFSFRVHYISLALLLPLAMVVAAGTGALDITPHQIVAFLGDLLGFGHDPSIDALRERVFFQIRAPRIILCALVGAALSVSGALMQALFRNPIVEPGLIGTSSGAALGAAVVFVLGKDLGVVAGSFAGALILPLFAFAGALVATLTVYRLASLRGRIAVATMLLVGIAVNAMAAGGTGYFSYIARDPQARSITFWSLGTFSGADWRGCAVMAAITIPSVFIALRYSKGLNALLLGEAEAGYLGVDTEKLKLRVILLNTLVVAAGTSMVGVIGFVGLIVPHLLRIAKSSDNRFLIIGSALLGGTVLIVADIAARLVIAPGELPIGIVTAFVGAPVFIWMLISNKRSKHFGGFYA
jgi:iron complex transport system permease protein